MTCAKTLLLENMAVGLETGALTVAHDLDGKQDLLNEIAPFELASTSAGNLVLLGGGKPRVLTAADKGQGPQPL